MSDSPRSYKSDDRLDALQTLIEVGGLDRDLMIQLRREFLDMTEREAKPANTLNLTERAGL